MSHNIAKKKEGYLIRNGLVFFAVADCTGHGVPGALVSVVCSTALNRSVKEFGITEPSKILDKTTELVIETFERSHRDVHDGMDISLAVFNLTSKQLNWAGANNPLWILRKESTEIEEIRPDKQPVAKFLNPKPFTPHEFQLNKGDRVYLFSDGFPDQFGGKLGKKN
ncbi:serine/threonine-protein phosphatase [Crocinitomix catalasitica]|nr:serine/threonine-protein phosphatase [Crocinitomix catalasitica]